MAQVGNVVAAAPNPTYQITPKYAAWLVANNTANAAIEDLRELLGDDGLWAHLGTAAGRLWFRAQHRSLDTTTRTALIAMVIGKWAQNTRAAKTCNINPKLIDREEVMVSNSGYAVIQNRAVIDHTTDIVAPNAIARNTKLSVGNLTRPLGEDELFSGTDAYTIGTTNLGFTVPPDFDAAVHYAVIAGTKRIYIFNKSAAPNRIRFVDYKSKFDVDDYETCRLAVNKGASDIINSKGNMQDYVAHIRFQTTFNMSAADLAALIPMEIVMPDGADFEPALELLISRPPMVMACALCNPTISNKTIVRPMPWAGYRWIRARGYWQFDANHDIKENTWISYLYLLSQITPADIEVIRRVGWVVAMLMCNIKGSHCDISTHGLKADGTLSAALNTRIDGLLDDYTSESAKFYATEKIANVRQFFLRQGVAGYESWRGRCRAVVSQLMLYNGVFPPV